MSDFFDCCRGGELVDGCQGEDRFALVDRLIGKRALAPLAGLDDRAVVGECIGGGRNIIRRKDPLDAGHRQRLVRMNTRDSPVRHGAEHQLAKQHSLGAKVLGVFCRAGHLRPKVRRRVVLANQLVTVRS